MLPHPATPPLSASCSSGQHFASGFLQIRSRPRHPCLWLTLPLAGCVEDFHLQVVQSTTTVNRTAPVTALRAMPGAQQKRPEPVGAFCVQAWWISRPLKNVGEAASAIPMAAPQKQAKKRSLRVANEHFDWARTRACF
ncbi:hypothetical protein DZC76_04480 [Pseudomonas sp. phDV1]|nr:hypothetical protein DZC76_04480 [Pseudomonas sp. phDV1]